MRRPVFFHHSIGYFMYSRLISFFLLFRVDFCLVPAVRRLAIIAIILILPMAQSSNYSYRYRKYICFKFHLYGVNNHIFEENHILTSTYKISSHYPTNKLGTRRKKNSKRCGVYRVYAVRYESVCFRGQHLAGLIRCNSGLYLNGRAILLIAWKYFNCGV